MGTSSFYLYLLLVFEIILFWESWKKFDHVIFSPTIYTCGVFIISTLLNIYCIDFWKIYFYADTFGVIVLGLLSVYLAEFFAYNKNIKREKCQSEVKLIIIPQYLSVLLSAICIISVYLYFREIQKIGIGESMLVSEAIGYLKEDWEEYQNKFNPMVRQLYKVVMAIAYITTYLFINNRIIFRETVKKTIWLIIPLLCSMLINIISGSRGDMIRMFLNFMFMYYVLVWQNSNWKFKPGKKLVKLGMPFIGILLSVFFLSRVIVKKDLNGQLQMGNSVQYFAYYIGSPIQVLNLHIHDLNMHESLNNNTTWGVATFGNFYKMIANFGVIDEKDIIKPSVGSGMVYIGGDSNASGNVETIFAPSHLDFSVIGMCVYVFIIYYLLSYFLYSFILYKPFSVNHVKRIIYFTFFYYIVELSFYDDCLKWIINQTGILQLICLMILVNCFCKMKWAKCY